MLDRKNTQSGVEFFNDTIGANALQMEAIVAADSIPDLFHRLEQAGVLLRLDRSVKPEMFHGATISQLELEALRRIKNVVRLGRVLRLEKDQIILEHGTLPTSAQQLHIDCYARAISNEEIKPIFQGKMMSSVDPADEEKQAIIARIRDSAFPAVEKLQQFNTQIQQA